VKTYLILLLLLVVAFTLHSPAQEPPYEEGQLLIQFERGADIEAFTHSFESIRLGPTKRLSRRMNIWLFEYDAASVNADGALFDVRQSGAVLNAQFNHYVTMRSVIPNDPQFGSQWALNNTGQNGGTPDADIDAPDAWDFATGGVTVLGDTIVVAVVDGGADLNHQDLRFFKNIHEIPGNSIDDDNNGYIDDYHGWNAYNSTGNVPSNSHGTHVSGIAAARGNNGIGVSGVNWGAKVLPVAGSSGTESVVVEAYGYVLEMRARYNETNGDSGAFIVSTNSSFGVDFGQPSQFPIWAAMYDSMGVAGILSAAATANLNIDVDVQGDMPTACPSDWLVAVTNTTNTDAKNSGAAYGLTTIDLGSPGTAILSTLPGNTYGNNTGTSMATPGVAGAIALMYSAANSGLVQTYKNNPGPVALMFKQWLLDGTDSIPALQGITVSGGRLNVHKSVLLVRSYGDSADPNPPLNVSAYSDYSTPTSMLLRWTNPTTLLGGGAIGPFVTRIRRDTTQVAEVPGPDSTYVDTGLTDGTLYRYTFQARLVADDSLSPTVESAWIAGGSRILASPSNLTVNGTSATGYTIRWVNPSRQIDGTPLDDLAGIRLYRDALPLTTLVRTPADTSRIDSTTDTPPAGLHTYYVTAIDNEVPVNESGPSGIGYTPLEVPFTDSFPTTGVPNASIWVSTNVDVNDRGLNEPSGLYSMNLNGNPTANGDVVEVLPLDLSTAQGSGIALSYSYQPRGTSDTPEVADSLIIEFRNNLGQWIQARRYPGIAAATPTPPYEFQMVAVESISPGSGTFFYNGFKFRIRSKGTAGAFDDWFVDDVSFGIPNAPPVMVVTTEQIADTVLSGTVDSTLYLFSVTNANALAAPLTYSVAENPPVSWLSLVPQSGSVVGNSSQLIRLHLDFSGSTPGLYTTSLIVSGNDPVNPSDTVSISFMVNPAPAISVQPDSLAFALNGGDSLAGSIVIRNSGLGPLTYTGAVEGGYAGQTSDNVGNTENTLATTSNMMRGGVVGVTTSVLLLEIRSWLNVITSVELRFVLYENTAQTGVFTKIFESIIPSSGTGTQFYSSGPVNIILQAGRYYAVGVNWNGGLSYFWDASAPVPIPVSFGTITGGLAQSVFPPPATVTQNVLTSLYYTQLVTASGRWLAIESGGSGTVAPGDSASLGFSIRTAQLPQGVASASLVIHNNDPVAGPVTVPITVDVLTGIVEEASGIPETFALDQNYPNPFNPVTRIRFALPRESTVRLVVYNMLGQEVMRLSDEQRSPGYFSIEWDGTNNAGRKVGSGVYFYRFEAKPTNGENPFVSLKKMVLVK